MHTHLLFHLTLVVNQHYESNRPNLQKCIALFHVRQAILGLAFRNAARDRLSTLWGLPVSGFGYVS